MRLINLCFIRDYIKDKYGSSPNSFDVGIGQKFVMQGILPSGFGFKKEYEVKVKPLNHLDFGQDGAVVAVIKYTESGDNKVKVWEETIHLPLFEVWLPAYDEEWEEKLGLVK